MTTSSKEFPLIGAVKDGIEILKLNKMKMMEIAAKDSATVWAFVILAVPFVVNLALSAIQTDYLALQVNLLLIPLVSTVAVIFIMSLIAQMAFHAKGDHLAFFRILGYAGVITWLGMIPYVLSLVLKVNVYNIFNMLNLLASVLMLIVTYHALSNYYKLNQQNVIITMVAGFIAALVVQGILGNMLVGPYYSMTWY